MLNTAMKKIITIVSTGNSGHVCAGLFEENTKSNVVTQILTRNPDLFTSMKPKVTFLGRDEVQHGKISLISKDPQEVLPQSDIVIYTGPVFSTKKVFEEMKPYIDTKKTVIGTIFGQGLVHISAQQTFGNDVRFFALRNIPWLCRLIKKGEAAEIVGPKSSIEACVLNLDQNYMTNEIQPLFSCQKIGIDEPKINVVNDWCPIVFNPANQIIHPAAYYGLFRSYDGVNGLPRENVCEWLYRGMDNASGEILECLDSELQGVKNAFYEWSGNKAEGCLNVLKLKDRLLLQYGDQIKDKSTMAKMVSTNLAYSMAKTPVLAQDNGSVKPFITHRVMQDDIGWGLCVILSVAEQLEKVLDKRIPTDMMKMLVNWHQDIMKKQFLVDNKLCGRDIDELVLCKSVEDLDMVSMNCMFGSEGQKLKQSM